MPTTPLIPKIPPLRTDIQEPQQSSAVNRPPAQGASSGANTASNGSSPQHRTSKEWYYYWSAIGKQVVENTQTLGGLVTYGPHADRPDPSTVPNGALAVESDRGAIYQNELINGVPTWWYIAGTMWGSLNPDTRPTDLGVHDAGFDFRGTDQQREFIWSGGAWVEVASQTGDAQIAYASAALALSGSDAAVPGASLTLNRAGRYLITGVFWFESTTGGQFLLGSYNHTNQNFAIYQSPAGTSTTYVTASQTWLYTASAPGQTVFLNAYIPGGSSSAASVGQQHTSISAIWVSP